MKIIPLFFYVILICCSIANNTKASVSSASTMSQENLKLHYYASHPDLFKEYTYNGNKYIASKIANISEIFHCGTPIKKERIEVLLKEINKALPILADDFENIKRIKKAYLGYNDDSDTIVKIDIHISAIQEIKKMFTEFEPPTINTIIGNLSLINDYISVNEKELSEYLKDLSDEIQKIQSDFVETRKASRILLGNADIQGLGIKTSNLYQIQRELFDILQKLHDYHRSIENSLHLLTDFHLQTRAPEEVAACPTDQYLRFLNKSIPHSNIVQVPAA